MKSAFDHFDKNDDGRLDHFEFRACLVSLGYNVDTEEHLVNHNVWFTNDLFYNFVTNEHHNAQAAAVARYN